MKKYRVEFRQSGRTIEVAEDGILLEQALRAGLRPRYSCQGGSCGTCMVQVQGQVFQWGRCISEEEKAQGFVLLCSSYAESDLVIDA